MNEKVVKKTQDTLGKIIKKPPLTEKLLNKPPFRFLHDVITSVIKQTEFMKGLYSDTEMNSENVKDKDSKVAFLQKAIDIVGVVLGKTLGARPSKIVAGHEPEKTNEFLQALAEAVNKKPNNEDIVKRVLGGEKPGAKASSSGEKERRSRDSSADKRKRRDKEDQEEKKEKDESKERRRRRDKDDKHRDRDDRSRDRDRSKDRSKDRDREKDREKRHRDREEKDRDREKDKDRERRRRHRDREDKKEEDVGNQGNQDDEPAVNGEQEEAEAKPSRGSSGKTSKNEEMAERAKEQERREKESHMNGTLGEDDLPPQVQAARKMAGRARPSSARPAPPRPKPNEQVVDEPHIVQGNVRNLIVDKDDSDDDDGFIAKEEEPQPLRTEPDDMAPSHDPDDDEDHGGLVKKILETKKELEGGSQTSQAKQSRRTEIERSHMNDATRRKEREMVQKEIEKLKGTIQTLTRSANPLGKIMDFVQEDLDSMQKELDTWKREHKENLIALQREQNVTEGSVEPLKAQLSELDQAISDQLDLIAAVKSNTIRNDERIEKMLGTVCKS